MHVASIKIDKINGLYTASCRCGWSWTSIDRVGLQRRAVAHVNQEEAEQGR